jgi:hypothetical protein
MKFKTRHIWQSKMSCSQAKFDLLEAFRRVFCMNE